MGNFALLIWLWIVRFVYHEFDTVEMCQYWSRINITRNLLLFYLHLWAFCVCACSLVFFCYIRENARGLSHISRLIFIVNCVLVGCLQLPTWYRLPL